MTPAVGGVPTPPGQPQPQQPQPTQPQQQQLNQQIGKLPMMVAVLCFFCRRLYFLRTGRTASVFIIYIYLFVWLTIREK